MQPRVPVEVRESLASPQRQARQAPWPLEPQQVLWQVPLREAQQGQRGQRGEQRQEWRQVSGSVRGQLVWVPQERVPSSGCRRKSSAEWSKARLARGLFPPVRRKLKTR